MESAGDGVFKGVDSIHGISSLLLSLLPLQGVQGGIFTRITMTSMTGAWYLPITHFEAILVGLVLLEIIIMRYFLILPLDITKLIDDGTLLSTSVLRKKRMVHDYYGVLQKQQIAESAFALIKRLDKDDCVLRTLCELEFTRKGGTVHLRRVSSILSHLKALGYKRRHWENSIVPNNITIVERKVLSDFEDAVLLGAGDNSTTCENVSEGACASQYSLCNEKTSVLLDYVDEISPFLK